VADLVAQVISLTQFRWRDQSLANGVGIAVETDIQWVSPIAGDDAELREALTNLVFNAIDAMPQGGTITLSARTVDGLVAIEIHDTGAGMTDEVRQRCMEPFFTTKGEHGTGLGLAMVFGIIQRHGGSIELKSAPGGGTSVVLLLPAAVKIPEREASPAQTIEPRSGLRVLVAEDEPSLREMLASYLSIDGHEIELAVDGHDAATKFKLGSFDVVLTDRAMPRVNGDQLAAAVKSSAPQTPVIMLSGFGDFMSGTGEQPHSVDLILSKPVSIAELRAALASVA
jgi:CheY-like chemotaxis protein